MMVSLAPVSLAGFKNSLATRTDDVFLCWLPGFSTLVVLEENDILFAVLPGGIATGCEPHPQALPSRPFD